MEKAIQGLFLFVALTVTSNVAKADWPVAPNGRVIDPRVANVGYFYCSDCVMTGSYLSRPRDYITRSERRLVLPRLV